MKMAGLMNQLMDTDFSLKGKHYIYFIKHQITNYKFQINFKQEIQNKSGWKKIKNMPWKNELHYLQKESGILRFNCQRTLPIMNIYNTGRQLTRRKLY